MQVGDGIRDCYMHGLGDMDDIGCLGRIEAAGQDWVVVRNQYYNKPIFVNKSLKELEEFLTN